MRETNQADPAARTSAPGWTNSSARTSAPGWTSADHRAIGAALDLSRHLGTLAGGFRAAAAGFPVDSPGWEGLAARALAGVLAAEPERFREAAQACARAGTALAEHADRLRVADWLPGQAFGSPTELARELDRRAAALAEDSARQAAGILLGLARSAPARPSRLDRWWHRLRSWRSEIQLGAAESSERLADTGLRIASRLTDPYPPQGLHELRAAGSHLLEEVQHPLRLAQAMSDWDTWRTDPARAVGHLLPDLAAALVSGGAATESRGAEVLYRGRVAVQEAAARDSQRRAAAGSVATASRQALVRRALPATERRPTESPGLGAWRGEGGTGLTPEQNEGVEAFHALNCTLEPVFTAALRDITRLEPAELAGLGHRLKDIESVKRKLATQAATTGRPLPALLAKAHDLVRYAVVIDDSDYVRAVPRLAAYLEERGFHLLGPAKNAWYSGRYRGINTRWQVPADGATFEVQFHTPASWRITKETHPMYEESRLPDTPPERVAQLRREIAQAYRAAPAPAGVEFLGEASLPPPSPPEPAVPPPDHTGGAAIGGGLGAQQLQSDRRRRQR